MTSHIFTVTLNPALDYVVRADSFAIGQINRSASEQLFAGGKGINVSAVLKSVGADSVALGFAAGFTGDALIAMLQEQGLHCDFLRVGGFTRINVKVRSVSEKKQAGSFDAFCETDLNGRGPAVSEADAENLLAKFDGLKEGDVLVLAGSLPAGLAKDFYAQAARRAKKRGARVAVDTSGEALDEAVKAGLWLIKPNLDELRQLCGKSVSSREELAACAKDLQRKGTENILVSLGGEGAYLLSQSGQEYFVPAPKGKAVDTVGAGDSLLAGFLAKKAAGESDLEALRYGIAAGSATAFCYGLAKKDAIEALYASVGGAER